GAHSAAGYSGSYEFQPSDRQFRSLPLTPKPRIYGIQTAKVVGKQGEDSQEISTDEHGRIWVKFYWDREPQKTCPIRVAQVWSGKNWGGHFIPRLGMEVVVEFLEGDPDRPLVTGCVFNGDNKYPYALPDNKTQSGIKSDSSMGHGGFNEWRFKDKKGAEENFVEAQKDLNTVIEHNETRLITQDRTTEVKNGNDVLNVKSGQILHTAKQKIVLTVDPSKITIDPTGITIDAPQITLKASELITINAP